MRRPRIAETPPPPRPRALRAITSGAAIAVVLVLAACGSDEPEPTADYPGAADEICLDVAEQLVDLRGDDPPPENAKEAAALLSEQIPIRQDGLDRLEALLPPPELVAPSDEYLTLAADRVDALEQALEAARDDDRKAYLEASEDVERISDRLRSVGEQAGFAACAELLPPAGQQDVLAVVEKLMTSQDSKKVCQELVTERFAESAFGSVEKCESDRFPSAVSLELLDVGGVGATSAFVDIEIVDIFGATRQQRVELVFDDEVWRVDSRAPLEVPEDEEGDEASEGGTGSEEETTTTPDEDAPTTTGESTAPE